MSDFTIGRNDRLPTIASTLRDEDGTPLDLTGCTVKFIMRPPRTTGTPKVTATATVVDAATGHVSYTWAALDTDTAGAYWAEWEVAFPGGKKITVPNGTKISVDVVADLG